MLIAARRNPAAAFVWTTRTSPWDEFQVAYFAGEVEAGDHSMHHPYQADHGRSTSAAGAPGAAAVPGGA